jgi:hypothetical protein
MTRVQKLVVLLLACTASLMALTAGGAQAAFKGKASRPKPSNLVISPGKNASVGGLRMGMTKSQAIAAWSKPSFCSRKGCVWFTKRQRRGDYDFKDDLSPLQNARGEFAYILLTHGVVWQIGLSAIRCPCGVLPRFRINDQIGLRTGYEAMQIVFTPGPCSACPGGLATVRPNRPNTLTTVFYLNDSGTAVTGYGVRFFRYPTHKIGYIVLSNDTSDPGR